ncbi:MAG: DUF1294 domain-containing protein [Planctomycetota bacterium]|nr:DUF1294 domain-containing protein [Planctomycetota bacterium]
MSPAPVILALYGLLTIAAFVLFGVDKRAAALGVRRTPEKTLLTLALAGGFAGAIAGMHVFRHKTRKLAFRIIPWASAALHAAAWIVLLRR